MRCRGVRGCAGRCRRWLWAVGEMDEYSSECPGVSWRVLERPGVSSVSPGASSARVRHTIGRIRQLRYLEQYGLRRPAPPLRWASSPSPPSLQISTHTVDSQPTLCPPHLLSAGQRAHLHHLFSACFVSPAGCLSAENPALSRNCIGRRAVLPPAPRSLSPPF